jgi:PAS domain S-box-containing protein
MQLDLEEEKLLHSVALQNARAILHAREKAERELIQTKEALEQKTGELSEQREWFAVTLSSIGDAVITTDLEGKVTFLNPVAETMTGWKSTKALGRPLEDVFQIVNEQTRKPIENPVVKVLKEGGSITLADHTALIAKNGKETAIEDSAAPIKDAAGRISGAVMVFHDVTSRRRAELEKGRLISVLERSLNEIYIFDTEMLRFEYVNEGARRNLGYTMEEMLKMTPLDLQPEFNESTFRDKVKPLLSGEKEKHIFQTVHRRKDKTLYPVEVHLQSVAHEGQRVFLAVILDITERRQSEEAKARLAAVVESSDDAIISKTLEGIITSWNEGARRMYGYEADEVIGKSVTILIPPHLIDEEPEIIQRLKQGKKIDHYETVRMRKDGTLLDVALTVSPIRDASGKIIGASKIARDVTHRKIAERALQRAKNELEQRVAERTASLQETTQQLEAFCYTIAHDLRSPLRAQQSYAQVLLEDYKNVLDEAGQEFALRIIKSAERLDKLVDDLLTYSRLSRNELNYEKVDLDKVVNEMLGHFADEIKKQQATVSVDPLLSVCAYEPTLNLVISNLFANALKFVKPGVPPQIHIWSESRENFIRLWVEDNGIGIDPEHRTKIFGVFERLHLIDQYPGTGIGLAIVHKGVERMDGRIGFESELGKGSRFWIELPKIETKPPEDNPSRPAASATSQNIL